MDKTIQSALTLSHSRTFAEYTNNSMPTVHARTWTNENSQERGQTCRHENLCSFKVQFERSQCRGFMLILLLFCFLTQNSIACWHDHISCHSCLLVCTCFWILLLFVVLLLLCYGGGGLLLLFAVVCDSFV